MQSKNNKNETPAKRPLKYMIISFAIGIVLLVIAGFYLLRYSGLPYDQFHPKAFSTPDTLDMPLRPGIQGIVISGPPLKDVYFKINLAAAGIRPIQWNELVAKDPTAKVTVRAEVLHNGDLHFSHKNDVKDAGHPEAGEYIAGKLSTWSYEPNKTGWIRFYFNVGSTPHQLIIDASDLKKSDEIPAKITVRDGQMHYIEGLASDQVGRGSVSF